MKKLPFIILLLAVLAMTLCACGDSGKQPEANQAPPAENTQASEKASYPSGLFMLKYMGDEAGRYVPESNEFLDFLNRPTTLLDMMWAENSTIWCQIGEDGIGTYTAPSYGAVKMDFNTGEPGMLLFGGLRRHDDYGGGTVAEEGLVPYVYDRTTGEFWFEEEPGFWAVMAPCSQAALNLVFEGKGGSVPLSEAEIGDLVCMGQYDTDPDNDKLEPLYWRVLDKDGDSVLLLSDQLIDSFSYNYNPDKEVLTDLSWENCSLREFLNLPEGFLSMFSQDEIARMQTTYLENKAANEELMRQWGSFQDQGEKSYSDLATQDRPDDPDTEDKVFLLSYQEVLKYFGEPTEDFTGEDDYPFSVMKVNPAWIATVTDAVTAGYYDNQSRGGAWMTRTLCNSHSEEDMVVYISSTGQVFDYYTYVPLFIRPAVWVSTTA